jgi:fatty acid desaturase
MATAAVRRDYSLTGPEADRAVERGLVAAEWYHSRVPRQRMKELMRRSDAPALRDLALWLALILGSGTAASWLYLAGSWWALPFFLVYGVLYGSTADARWHECGHGTAFKTRWLNDLVYEIASFMVFRNATVWRWSHARHHTDTIIVGRDPEIVAMRPPHVWKVLLNFLALPNIYYGLKEMVLHARGRLTPDQATFIPPQEHGKVFLRARLYLAIYTTVLLLAIGLQSFLPLLLVGLPVLYGGWLIMYLALTQHVGLAEDVLDHRLNTRTIYMNPVLRFFYLNMNYHVEHHMFPMVPYHNLPALHDELKDDLPEPYHGTFEAYREIIATLRRQLADPGYFVTRKLPPSARPYRPELHDHGFADAS